MSEASYYVESNGEAAVIDPLRDVDGFLSLAQQRNAKIKYVFETHFHADFVSGHVDLARQTGATIVYGPNAEAAFEFVEGKDGEEFQLGDCKMKLLHTPGHTMESSCFVALNEEGKEEAVLTGDTLFIGDVGRPDLAVNSTISKEELAQKLYRSINEKLMTLEDEVVLYPGHGAGSPCGKKLGKATISTIGEQKKNNYALKAKSEDEFVERVVDGLTTPPAYFPENVKLNKEVCETLTHVLHRSVTPLSCNVFKELYDKTLVVDTRPALEFAKSHIPGSINIGLDDSFAIWAGTIIKDLNRPLLLITDEGQEEEAVTRLARVGFNHVIGYLDGGLESWEFDFKTSSVSNVCPVSFVMNATELQVIDVRTASEFQQGHVTNAINLPLADLSELVLDLDVDQQYYVYCKSGYRSMIAASMMKSYGFNDVINVKKGYDGITDPSKRCCQNG